MPHAASFHGVAKILLSLPSTSVPRFAGEREEKEKKFPPQLEEKNFYSSCIGVRSFVQEGWGDHYHEKVNQAGTRRIR